MSCVFDVERRLFGGRVERPKGVLAAKRYIASESTSSAAPSCEPIPSTTPMPPMLTFILLLLLVGLSKATTTPNAVVKGIPTTAKTTSVPHVCWQCQGPFELDCFHAEALTLEPYPLTAEICWSGLSPTGLRTRRSTARSKWHERQGCLT